MASGEELLARLSYFAFVTIGTLGYGDVVPGSPVGESFVILVSISSTLYVSLLIGLLLSRYINSRTQAAVVMWIPFILGHHAPAILHGPVLGGICLFYLLTAARIVQLLATLEGVNWRSLCLGAAGYVQLGLTAGQIATLMAVLRPGSFQVGAMLPGEELVQRLNYFAFVTLGSIGYGDVLPGPPRRLNFLPYLSAYPARSMSP